MHILPTISILAFFVVAPIASRTTSAQGLGDAFPSKGAPVMAESMGHLKEHLIYGEEGDWSGSVGQSGYELKCKGDESDVKYFFVNTLPELDGKRTLSGTVNPVEGGSCGFIYGYHSDPTRYYLFVVDSSRSLRILERSPDGFSEMGSMSTSAQGPVNLKIVENGSEIEIYVNGERKVAFGNEFTGKGGVGIAAIGNGTYVFDGFKIDVK